MTYKFIRNFSHITAHDGNFVGGKGANLGEMTRAGFPVPPGFVVTAQAYFAFLEENKLKDSIKKTLDLVNPHDATSYQRVSEAVQKIILSAPISDPVAKEIFHAYEALTGLFSKDFVAVRSSATAEDLPGASFAGQQATYLNVSGEAVVIDKVRQCWASLFTPRAIFYRENKHFDHFKVGIAVVVQKMIQSEVSGVMFTINPVTNDKRTTVIEAVWGLGELIVQGSVTPDHYEVDKTTEKIIKKITAKQIKKLSYSQNHKTVLVEVAASKQNAVKLSDHQIVNLYKLGKKIHHHYFYPQDIEWALYKNKFYLIQTRPVTTIEKIKEKKEKTNTQGLALILKGDPASPGISTGFVRLINSEKQIGQVNSGDVLVTSMTTPDFVPAMKKVKAIVTDKGGQTSHAAIVSRELGVPCVVGTQKATQVLKNGQLVTVNGKTGEVFKGGLKISKTTLNTPSEELSYQSQPLLKLRTATKLYVNLAEPHLAQKIAAGDVDGVGLLRAEFMIADIGTHPRKLIEDGKSHIFVDKLCEGLKTFCEAFNPRPVVYRTTDFKTNEYSHLKGGAKFEPTESNPLLGFRGAYRYMNDEKVFSLELEAIKRIRNKYNLKNIHMMIPFVRTPHELLEVKKIIAAHGLTRTPSFKLWMMVEIPSNVILLEEFIKIGIDGVSIGSNDLTMLLLGLDRDNETVAGEFDETNAAVLWALEKVVKTCHKLKITSSICGQAPSKYPKLTEKLVSWGITSVSVTPDMIAKTRKIIYDAEKALIQNHGKD